MPAVETDSAIVICAIPFASSVGDAYYGQRLRSDHPLVLAAPKNFVKDGTIQSEWPTEFDHSIRMMEAQENALKQEREERTLEQAKRNRIRLEPPRLFQLRRDVIAHRDGQPATILKGSVVLEGDPLLSEHADAFEKD